MPKQSSLFAQFIQIETRDPVWEWHIPSDRLFLSSGAVNQLRLQDNIPHSMKEFLTHCPLEGLSSYLESVEKVLNGSQGPHLELIYPLDNLIVRAQMLVLQRDIFGRGSILVGSLTVIDKQTFGPVAVPVMDAPPQTQDVNSFTDASRLLLALNAASDGLWDWDTSTNAIYFSPRYFSMLGYDNDAFPHVAESWISKVHPDDFENIISEQMQIIQTAAYGDNFECTYRMLRGDGAWAWILSRGYVTHRDANGKATRLVGLHTDVSASQGDRARLEDLVRNDALTGLRSRAYYGMTVERLEQQKTRPVSIISCDMDGLKLVNDHLGHPEGSKMLCQAALLLRHSLCAVDCIARMGGDEFVAILPECLPEQLTVAIERIYKAFEKYNTDPENIPIRMSIGGACAEDMETSLVDLLVASDREMLRVKHQERAPWRNHIKDWIEKHTDKTVQLEDARYM